jgi:cell wall-associated NlpC family hydrolase
LVPNRDLGLVPLTRSVRDLGDERLWDVSLRRSLDRRHAAPVRRTPGPATASLALVVSAVALPGAVGAAPAAAAGGLSAIQQALGVKADGVMGPETRSALRRFQRSHGLAVDGQAGSATRAALGIGGGTTIQAEAAQPAQTTGSVADVQRKLGVDADGVMGPVTRQAVSAFQTGHQLPATGRLDRATRNAILQSEDAGATRSISLTTGAADTGAAAPGSAEPAPAPVPAAGVSAAVEAARAQVGKPYRSAGKGPGGFDCSGLTAFAFKAAGISLGASSFAQYAQGTRVAKAQIQAGDLVFFNSNGSGASHVGVATSPTTMISATSHGVMENGFTSGYWASHYVGARRVS